MFVFFKLKSEIEKKKQEEERLEKRMAELETENRRMREPLEAAKREAEELSRKAESYKQDKALLLVCLLIELISGKYSILFKSTKRRLKTCETDMKTAKWEYEVLLQRFEIVR